ncbi:MAG: DNA polymerase III subunit alpha [Bacilli bacterium]|nr:DNA polymerase III subunit alpha [Bacilli bacterium]
MYTPLYIKTDNSLQTSLIKVIELIEFAKQNNIKSLTITDNNMYGVMDFYKLCITNNIKPIIGLEVEYNDKKIVLYAENYDGYKNLLKLCTIQSEKKLEIQDLEKYSKNLVCITPYESIYIYNNIKKFYKNIFIGYRTLEELNNMDYDNTVYMNETLYLTKEDSKYIKYIDAVRTGATIDLVVSNNLNNYILKEEEFESNYKESIDNNHLINELCNVEIPFNQKLMPKFVNDEGLDSYTYLKKKCIEGLRYHFGNSVNKIYKERLKYELEIINKMGFCDYFLIVSDYVKYAKDNNIIVGTGRGSAVGSLVSYCLRITDVDPIKYNLLFERFLNPERVSMPDIDIDFEHERREDIINYCIEKYGRKKVVPIITFGTLGAKQAIRDVGKSMDIELGLIDTLCKLIDSRKTLKENYNDNKKIKELLERKEILKECYKIAIKFEGLKRHTSIHAAGVIMSSVDLDEIIPLDKSHNFYLSGYDMTYLEEIGLLKMDFLAIKYLTTIHNIIDSINSDYNLNIKFDEIPLNDSKALNIFNKADTIGIFQFESDGMINFLRKLKVTSMDDIFAAIALFRPGPMQNIPTYINRKNRREKIDYIDSSLESILKSTYGIMIYQEQIMQIARTMADYTLGEADILRKAMSKKKKDILLEEKEKFTSRAIKKGYGAKLVDRVYELMLKFAEYGFNKSHSIGYSIVAYKMAYLKAHYPKNFITYLLSMEINDDKKTKQYIYEAKKNNIEILKPDINLSDRKYKIEHSGIRYPLSNIRNVGTQGSELIIKERELGLYTDIFDFIKRCYGKSVTRKTLESLIYAGVFDNFGYNKNTLINNLDSIINYGELIKDLDKEFALQPEIISYEEYTKKELMEQELNVFGFYLTNNPITEIKLKYKNIVNLSEISSYFDKNINTIVYVDRLKETTTSKGDKMCFISGSDEISTVDVVLFPKVYEKYNNIKQGDIVFIKGKVEKRFDKNQVVVNSIEKL